MWNVVITAWESNKEVRESRKPEGLCSHISSSVLINNTKIVLCSSPGVKTLHCVFHRFIFSVPTRVST